MYSYVLISKIMQEIKHNIEKSMKESIKEYKRIEKSIERSRKSCKRFIMYRKKNQKSRYENNNLIITMIF